MARFHPARGELAPDKATTGSPAMMVCIHVRGTVMRPGQAQQGHDPGSYSENYADHVSSPALAIVGDG